MDTQANNCVERTRRTAPLTQGVRPRASPTRTGGRWYPEAIGRTDPLGAGRRIAPCCGGSSSGSSHQQGTSYPVTLPLTPGSPPGLEFETRPLRGATSILASYGTRLSLECPLATRFVFSLTSSHSSALWDIGPGSGLVAGTWMATAVRRRSRHWRRNAEQLFMRGLRGLSLLMSMRVRSLTCRCGARYHWDESGLLPSAGPTRVLRKPWSAGFAARWKFHGLTAC